jgi:nucleoside phosphorylase
MTARARLVAPGLLAHVFLAAAGEGAPAGWSHLRSLWDDVTGRLGLSSPVGSLGVPRHLPDQDAVPGDGPGLLAAAESREESVWQACAWADYGVLCLTAMMAPPRDRDCGPAWAELERTWREAVAGRPADGVLGEALILLALLARPSGAGLSPDDAAGATLDLVRAAVPGPASAGWWRHWDAVPLDSGAAGSGGLLAWEASTEPADGRSARRLAAVTGAEFERQADLVVWTAGDGAPAPLARHLLHAARLRAQIRVFDGGRPPRRVRDEIGLLADDLSRAAARQQASDQVPERLDHARRAGLTMRTRLAAMRQAVRIIEENMRHALSPQVAETAVGPLSEDRRLAAWFAQRLDDEISRLDEAIAGAAAGLPLPGSPRGAACRVPVAEPQVVIFAALEVEYEAIRAYLDGPVRQREERGTLYELGTLPGARGSWQVAIAQTGPGSTAAGVQLERAVSVFAPDVVLFLGVAGGRKDVAHGDVVVGDMTYDYEWGKSTLQGHLPRMRTHFPSYSLLQRARLVVRQGRWQQRIRPACPEPPPAAFVKPIVTGSKVVTHDLSATALLLDRYASDAVAVETEGHGFLEGAYVNPGTRALLIRGISDLLSDKDPASDTYWQPVASSHAAAFAVELLDSLGTA